MTAPAALRKTRACRSLTKAALTQRIREAEKQGYRIGGLRPDGTLYEMNGDIIELVTLDREYIMRYCHCSPEQFSAFIAEGLLPKPQGGTWNKIDVDAALKRLRPKPYNVTYSEVYFIEMGDFIKIGFSASAHRRLDDLQTASPYDLKILGTFNGDHGSEDGVHRIFRHLHHRGEWFRKSAGLLAYIEWITVRERGAI